MNIALWITQGLLGLLFFIAGWAKIPPKSKFAKKMKEATGISASTVSLIGVVEILCAIGIVLPDLTGILPWLSPLAAVGLVLTMIGAAISNARQHEYKTIITNMVFLLLAAFVVYGRFVASPL